MIAAPYTFPLLILSVAVGVIVSWLGIRLRLMYRAQRRITHDLAAQTKLAKEHEATIAAYRQLVAGDANFALAPSAPSPSRWQKMASATRRS
jgi:hypothetical protein